MVSANAVDANESRRNDGSGAAAGTGCGASFGTDRRACASLRTRFPPAVAAAGPAGQPCRLDSHIHHSLPADGGRALRGRDAGYFATSAPRCPAAVISVHIRWPSAR